MTDIHADNRGLVVICDQCGQRNRAGYESLAQTFRCGQCHHELHPTAVPVEIQDEKAFGALIDRSELPVLVDFWAPWCGPCRMVSPALEQVATELAGRIKLVKVNVDDSPKLQQRFNVMAIPTLMVLRHGQVAAQRAGAVPAASLRAWVEEILGS